MRGITILGLAAMLSAVMVSCGKKEPLRLPASDPIPIHAWWSIPADSTSVERYRELAEAGFATSMSPFPNADAVQKALDAAQAAGVKLFITCPELKSAPDSTVRRFMNHPALAGYHITDEPNAALFSELGEWVKKIQAVDSSKPCYINLFPTYATAEQLGTPTYQAHVDSFVATVPVQQISLDHYPVMVDSIRSDYDENLSIIAEASRKTGKPFWAFALSVACNTYEDPSTAGLRMQMYTNLAYGAKGLQYFTYWTPPDPVWNFHDAPIAVDGTQSPTYAMVRNLNRELQARAGVFMGSTVTGIWYAGENPPRGTKPYEPMPEVTALTAGGKGALVSRLEKDNLVLLVLVNRDVKNPLPLTVGFAKGISAGMVGRDGSVTEITGEGFQGEMEPGDAAIFMWVKR